MEKIKNEIIEKITMEQEISPFLFISENTELLNSKVETLALDILNYFDITNYNLFKFPTQENIIKIWEVKEFLKITDSKTSYKFQIIFIEDFGKANIKAQNSCLKKFEEPWVKNIFFLTNSSESWILDTILSRVQVKNIWLNLIFVKNDFYYNLLDESIKNKNTTNLIKYFFVNKLEKTEYINFLETLIKYSKDNFVFIDYLEEIFEDLNMIKTNNLLAKITIDKWIIRIINDLA